MANNQREKSPYDSLNRSVSKMMYSFPKANRFCSPSRLYSDKFYDLPSSIGQGRKAGIGFGRKSEVSDCAKSNSPSPAKYEISSLFDEKSGRGTKFGFGRAEIKVGAFINKSDTPSPAAYRIPSLLKEHPEISLKPRLKDITLPNANNPGPGSYCLPEFISKSGIYAMSGVRNSPIPSFAEHKTVSKKKRDHLPGPGAYETKENISTSGRYFNSKYHDSLTRTFGKMERRTIQTLRNEVGPGAYNVYSQFS